MNSPFIPLPYAGDDESDWMTDALCAQVATGDVWFDKDKKIQNFAKAVCKLCGVRPECLELALRTGQRFGVWGGMTERERRKIRRTPAKRSLKAPHGTSARYRQHHRDNERACTACRDAEKLRRQELRERRSS